MFYFINISFSEFEYFNIFSLCTVYNCMYILYMYVKQCVLIGVGEEGRVGGREGGRV